MFSHNRTKTNYPDPMPRTLDTDARDHAVLEASWRVIRRAGMPALTVRNVAAEAGLAPSSLRYTFPTQASVRERAIAGVLERIRDRIDALPADLVGRAWARGALLELLPLDEQRRAEVEVYFALNIAALSDPALADLRQQLDDAIADLCARAAAAIGADATAGPTFHALADGLALHLVTRPATAGTAWAIEIVDAAVAARASAR